LDEILVKIVKVSNLLISSDYAIFSRKGSEIGGLIRLVSYVQGSSYREKTDNNGTEEGKDLTLIDLVKEILQ
jgi:hypothetical protein